MNILSTYISSLGSISQIYFIIIVAFIFKRKGLVTREGVKMIAKVSTMLFLPALIFSKNIAGFFPEKYPWWWMVTIWSSLIIVVGILIMRLVFINKGKSFRDRYPLGVMQNSGYFVLPIGMVLYPNNFDEFSSFVFLVVLGVSPTIWSFGKWLLTPNSKVTIGSLITPPFVANVSSIIIVLLGGREFVPNVILSPLELFGKGAIPLGLFVLGANLADINMKSLPPFINLVKVNSVKFLVIPSITFVAIYFSGIVDAYPILKAVLLIESCAPPAVALMLISETYHGNTKMVSSYIGIGYLLALFIVPAWLTLFSFLI